MAQSTKHECEMAILVSWDIHKWEKVPRGHFAAEENSEGERQSETTTRKKIKICDKNKNIFFYFALYLCCLQQTPKALLGGLQSTEVAFLRLTQKPQVRYLAFPDNFTQDLLMALLRTVDKGLIMTIEPT